MQYMYIVLQTLVSNQCPFISSTLFYDCAVALGATAAHWRLPERHGALKMMRRLMLPSFPKRVATNPDLCICLGEENILKNVAFWGFAEAVRMVTHVNGFHSN